MAAFRPLSRGRKALCIASFSLLLAGCYHATVDTGLAPSAITHKIWAHSWIEGLIPPAIVNAKTQCESGVARVETKHTFLNMLIGGLTFGIYTPMEITVTCASGTHAAAGLDSASVVQVPASADDAQILAAFAAASDKTVSEDRPAYVVFEGMER